MSKSFWCMGKRLETCLGCKYCRELDGQTDGFDMNICPSKVNPLFKKLPVAVSIFHGDPSLQVDNTLKILDSLQESGHTGPVVIVIKGDFSPLLNAEFNLDLHFAFSTFGIDHPLDGGSTRRFRKNLDLAKCYGKHKYSIEFRPIIHGINDSEESILFVMNMAKEHNMAVGYSGLQVKPGVMDKWDENDKSLMTAYPGTTLGYKKMISDDVDQHIRSFIKSGIPVFRKTSCLLSYVHGLNRDYNAHYYRPNEIGCSDCVMLNKCTSFKIKMDEFLSNNPSMMFDIPFSHKVKHKTGHSCPWLHYGCSFPTADCSNLSGNFIEINQKVTTSDVRVIKWLTGLTVSSEFEDSPYLSKEWGGFRWLTL